MIVYILSLLLALSLYSQAPSVMDKPFMLGCLVLAITNSVLFVYKTNNQKKYNLHGLYIRHSIIFMICFFIVFFQKDFDYVLGIIDSSNNLLWYDSTVVCKSAALSLCALLSFYLGYELSKKTFHISNSTYTYSFKMKEVLVYVGYVSLIIYLIFVPKSYLLGGYNAGENKGWANVILVLLQALFLALFAIYSYDYKHAVTKISFWKFYKKPIILVLIYSFIILVSGRRTEAIRMFILLIVIYAYAKGRTANYKAMGVVMVSLALVMSILSFLRTGKARSFSQGVEMVSESKSFLPVTDELASSVNTLHIAVSNFPDILPYTKGLTFFPNFLVLVPGLDQYYQNNIRGNGVITSSAEMITYIQFGDNASYGLGSSLVADAYIPFGLVGVLIIFMIFGGFIHYLEVGTFYLLKSPYFLVTSFCCCSQFMFACRGSFANLFLSWSYATLIVFFISSRHKYAK